MTATRALRLATAAVLAALAAPFVVAGPAAAHVSVSPEQAVQGEFTRVAFRVPAESDTASTTKVEIFLPENAPIPSVSTQPVAGWSVAVQRRTLEPPIESHGSQVSEVVSALTWTADNADAGIGPGQFQEFPVSLGPLPEVDRLVFKALQTYSDRTVVRWIEEPASGEEPENPAPVLALVPAAAPVPGTGGSGGPAGGGDGAALGLAIAGLVVGAAGLVLGGLAFMRTRRTS